MDDLMRLVEILEELHTLVPDENLEESDGTLYYPESFSNSNWEALRDEAESLCFKVITDNNGHPKLENRMKLQENGFHTYAGDGDSFGWLVGCISKYGRVMTFG